MIQQAIAAVGGADKLKSIQLIVLQGSGTYTWLGEGMKAGDPGPTTDLKNFVEVYDYANGRAGFEFDIAVSSEPPGVGVGGLKMHRREVLAKYGEAAAARPVGHLIRPDLGESVMSPGALYSFTHHPSPEVGLRRSYLAIVSDINGAATDGQMAEEREFDGKMRTFATAKTRQGEPLNLYFDPETKLLVGYDVTETHPVLGDHQSTYTFDDFTPVDGVPFPHRVKIRGQVGNSADIEYTSVTFGEGALTERMLAIPESAAGEATKAMSGDYVPLELFPVAPGVFQVNGYSHSSMVVEFPRWLVVVETPIGELHSKSLNQLLKKQFPGKPVRYVALSHPHYDHMAGARAFAAWGATILAEKTHEAELKRILEARHTYPPDELERNRGSQQNVGGLEVYEGKKVISEGGRTLELYAIQSPHVETIVIAYLPGERVLFQSDLGPKPIFDAATKLNLRPDKVLSGHGAQGAPRDGIRPFAEIARLAGGS